MSAKEKVIGTHQSGLEVVRISYWNERKSPQGFYDYNGNLVVVKPGETTTFDVLRPKPIIHNVEPVELAKEAEDAPSAGSGPKPNAGRRG